MLYSLLACLVSVAHATTLQPREDVAQIARNVSGFTAYDVLNYTKVDSDDSWKLEVPLRILCVGDSITEGWGSDVDGGDGNGYRLSLAKHLSRKLLFNYLVCYYLMGMLTLTQEKKLSLRVQDIRVPWRTVIM
jgi:hypothetical protein